MVICIFNISYILELRIFYGIISSNYLDLNYRFCWEYFIQMEYLKYLISLIQIICIWIMDLIMRYLNDIYLNREYLYEIMSLNVWIWTTYLVGIYFI